MTMIKGIAASNGIAIAKAYKLVMPDLTRFLQLRLQLSDQLQG